MLGYVKNGKYHRGTLDRSGDSVNSLGKAQDHDDQRFMHQADLIQPYRADGSVNPEFIELYYEESVTNGLTQGPTQE